MPELQTLDQQRAAFAWEKINEVKSGLKDYLPLARNLPAMVQTNGLGQTLVFLMSQEGIKYKLYLHLQEWLCVRAPHPIYAPESGQEVRLMRSLTNGSSLTLRHATLEVKALSVWLKRLAEALESAPPSSKSLPPKPAAVEPVPLTHGGS